MNPKEERNGAMVDSTDWRTDRLDKNRSKLIGGRIAEWIAFLLLAQLPQV